jgi:hypothetical protein
MSVAVHVPAGYKLITKISISYPKETFVFLDRNQQTEPDGNFGYLNMFINIQ